MSDSGVLMNLFFFIFEILVWKSLSYSSLSKTVFEISLALIVKKLIIYFIWFIILAQRGSRVWKFGRDLGGGFGHWSIYTMEQVVSRGRGGRTNRVWAEKMWESGNGDFGSRCTILSQVLQAGTIWSQSHVIEISQKRTTHELFLLKL